MDFNKLIEVYLKSKHNMESLRYPGGIWMKYDNSLVYDHENSNHSYEFYKSAVRCNSKEYTLIGQYITKTIRLNKLIDNYQNNENSDESLLFPGGIWMTYNNSLVYDFKFSDHSDKFYKSAVRCTNEECEIIDKAMNNNIYFPDPQISKKAEKEIRARYDARIAMEEANGSEVNYDQKLSECMWPIEMMFMGR